MCETLSWTEVYGQALQTVPLFMCAECVCTRTELLLHMYVTLNSMSSYWEDVSTFIRTHVIKKQYSIVAVSARSFRDDGI